MFIEVIDKIQFDTCEVPVVDREYELEIPGDATDKKYVLRNPIAAEIAE